MKLYIISGPLEGREFEVTPEGLRLGRSSSCEISIPDPALSRNNSLFELREGAIWVTDLASANGTLVNDVEIGAKSVKLAEGDIVVVGDTRLSAGRPKAKPASGPAPEPEAPKDAAMDMADASETPDLGLGGGIGARGEAAPSVPPVPAKVRIALWSVALLMAALAVAAWFAIPYFTEPVVAGRVQADEPAGVFLVEYEKVEASATGIHRYALEWRKSTEELRVKIDEVGAVNRHVDEKKKLSAGNSAVLQEILSRGAFRRLESEYAGRTAKPNELKSVSFKVVDGAGVFETAAVNTPEPEAMADVRASLESFAQNELAISAMQYSQERLIELSRESEAAADELFAERDVRHGNLAAALGSYRKAIDDLKTVEPKPEWFAALVDKERRAAAELEKRVKELNFRSERALNLQDWPLAKEELSVLAETLDPNDERMRDVRGKIMDVERRISDAKRRRTVK